MDLVLGNIWRNIILTPEMPYVGLLKFIYAYILFKM
jgi:hypothetical protein